MRRMPGQITDIDRDFQQKERQEFSAIPDTKIRRRGERELFTPNADDDYAIINTKHGWQSVAFLKVETGLPANHVGQNGEYRILSTSSKNSLLFKSNNIWYELNTELIASAMGLDSLAISTVGHAAYTAMSSGTVSTAGYHSF